MKPRRDLAVAAVVAVLVLALWSARFLFTGGLETLSGTDLRGYYAPLYEVTADWVAGGRLPLWNPYQQMGIPWLPTLQGGYLYPPHALYLILPTPAALAASHALHLLALALFTALLARRIGASSVAAGLAGILVAGSPVTLKELGWPCVLEALVWLPLGAVAVLDLGRGGGTRSVALLGLAATASFLVGYPQVSAFSLYVWASLLPAALLEARAPRARWIAAGAGFALAVGLAVLASAAQLLPTWEHLRETAREAERLSQVQAASYGPNARWFLSHAASGDTGAFPLAALALAPAAFFSPHRVLAAWALLLGAASYALAAGAHTDLFAVYQALPVLGWFRSPQRLFLFAQLCAALLAALGCDALLRDRRAARTACVAGLAAAGIAAWQAAPAQSAVGIGFAAVAATRLLRARFASDGVAVAAISVLAVVGVATTSSEFDRMPYSPGAERRDDDAVFFRALAAEAGGSRATWISFAMPTALKLGARYGVRWADDYEPLQLRRQDEFRRFLLSGSVRPSEGFLDTGPLLPQFRRLSQLPSIAPRCRLLDLAAVRFFVVAPATLVELEAVREFLGACAPRERPSAHPTLGLHENPRALPRAFVTYRALPAPDAEPLLRRLAKRRFDPLGASFVEGDPGLPAPSPQTPRGHPASIVRDDATVVEIEVELAAPGLVVLADSYARGWRASVDGEPAPIFPTNHLFRGVPAPAGVHRVRFEYALPGLRAGAAASVFGAAALLALSLRRR